MADIKDKIKKLLSLATSPNENEARDAMLKARALMAKNKLSEADFVDKDPELVHLECKDATWTTDSGNIWMTNICKLLCDNYCCASSWRTPKGSRTHTLVITGFRDDAEICKSVVEYAIGFVLGQIRILQRKNLTKDGRTIAASYAQGFAMGLEFALEEQNEQEWGLVLVKPDEVNEYERGLGSRNVRTRKVTIDQLSMMRGQNDGMRFTKMRALQG